MLYFTVKLKAVICNFENIVPKGEMMMVLRERKLTQKELKRKENFDKLSSEMKQTGYKEKDLTFSVLKANFAGVIITLPFIALIAWLYYTANPIADSSFKHRILFVFCLFVQFSYMS